MRDTDAMDRALEVAATARRHAPPWPWVGCVVVRDGAVVGAGATGPFPVGPHAEPAALAEAGARARGATAYVTLEPCAHHGNTPPCTEALVAAGVRRVVVALGDPDPLVAGRGLDRLRAAGVEVVVGVGADAARRQLAPYLHQRRHGSPYVVVKVATSLDGRAAAADGTSRWVTSAAARADAHELRADSQAIVVGSGTALADRPALTVRGVRRPPREPPVRVLLDARGRVPATGPLFDPARGATLVVTTEHAPPSATDGWHAAGAKVEVVAAAPGGGVDLAQAFAVLGRERVLQVLVEGGGTVAGAMIAAGAAHRLVAYVAPTLLGVAAPSAYALAGPATIAAAPRFALTHVARLGDDVRLDYELEGPPA